MNDSPLYKWYAVQTRSNMEGKAVEGLKRMIDIEDMGEYISKDDILMPEEKVSEVKNGKKTTRNRKLYPGYIFIKIKLYDVEKPSYEDEPLIKPLMFVRGINGVINFMGDDKRPMPLSQKDVDSIFEHIKQSEGVEKPKVAYEVGQSIKINDGPFLSLIGKIEEVDPEHGKLKVSVSIFGRFTPVELEYWQVDRVEDQ